MSKKTEKSYFDVLGLCCSSEVPLIEKILRPMEGVHDVSVIVPSRTVIVVHDPLLVSQLQIVKELNKARLEANVRVKGDSNFRNKWPSPFAVVCGILLLLSFLSYVFSPFKWLAIGAVAVGIYPVILKSIASLRNFRLDVNTLMLIAVAGSIVLKDYWEAGTIVFLFTTAEWLESRAGHKAKSVMSSLMNMAPQKAILASNGEEVNANEVMVNTKLVVKAGDAIPIDGIVVQGRCEVDEKALTGESFPVPKQVDSAVWAGTINVNGYISINTTVLAEDCVVARMAKLVEEAQNNKCKTQRYIDECAKYYTPAVVVIAACLAAIPAAMKLHNLVKWYHLALVVLVSSCPCALILSTPVATYCALSKAATTGLLIKGAEYLETLSKVKTIAFDKTGTITRGEFSVSNFRSLSDDISLDKLLYWVSSIEIKSSHPMASALIDYAQSKSVEPQSDNVEEYENFPGEGIYGKIEGNNVYVGNQKIALRAGCSTDLLSHNASEKVEGKSTGYIFLGSSLVGVFSLSDACRTGAKEALKELKSMSIKTVMLTGDCQAAASHAQNQLDGALEIVHAELLPQDKAKFIKDFQKVAPTAMVGDGINDAPALATADIGISMGISGSALATETGQVILMSNDIRKIPIAVRLARKTRRKIFENIFLAVITKAAIIALAIAGHPLVWAAVLADVGTCLVVILNSMLLLRTAKVAKSMKKHSGSSHDHKHCHSSHKHVKCSSDKHEHTNCHKNKCSDVVEKNGCCGHDGKVHGPEHLIQQTEDKHSCCGHVDKVHEKNLVQRAEDKHSCCGHDDMVYEKKNLVQRAEDKHSCCGHDDMVHEKKHLVQRTEDKHSCCGHVDKVHELPVQQEDDAHSCCGHDGKVHGPEHLIQRTEDKHSCCGHVDIFHELKHSVQLEEDAHSCCGCDDKVHELKHSVQRTEDKHSCCDHDDTVHELVITVQPTEDKHNCCGHDDHVHEINKPVQETEHVHEVKNCRQGTNKDCCAHDDKHVNVVKNLVHDKGSKHGCCDHSVVDVHEDKLTVQGHQKHECCAHDEGYETKHGEPAKENTHCLRTMEKRHSHSCCNSFRKECCRHKHFGVGFNGGLSEIVIE